MEIKIIQGAQFKKELKKYSKKFRSLEGDLDKIIPVLRNMPTGNKSKHWNVLKNEGKRYIMKIRLACRSLKGKKLFRVIYFYDNEKIYLELIEIYFKGKKSSENNDRITDLWATTTKDIEIA